MLNHNKLPEMDFLSIDKENIIIKATLERNEEK